MGWFAQGISLLQEYFILPKLVSVQTAEPIPTTGAAPASQRPAPSISIAIFAWNEERIIGSTLSSLFGQSIFAELSRHGRTCEVICVVNGCSDDTPVVANRVLEMQSRMHPYDHAFTARVEKSGPSMHTYVPPTCTVAPAPRAASATARERLGQ